MLEYLSSVAVAHMEYLTLQDIPHRHCEPLHSRKMTSAHPAERPLANMVAAVSQEPESPSSLHEPTPIPPRFLEPALHDPFRVHGQESATLRARASEPFACPRAPAQYYGHPHFADALGENARSLALPRSYSLPTRRRSHSPEPRMLPASRLPTTTPDTVDGDELRPSSTTLTESQNHHMRSSPPIQPGEQNFPGKLPSFSEVCPLPADVCHPQAIDFFSFSTLRGPPHLRERLSVEMTLLKALPTCNLSLKMYLGQTAREGASTRSAISTSRLCKAVE